MKILITGVSSGLGRALTKRLVEEGHQVWGVARREERLKSLAHELGNSPLYNFSAIDLSDSNSWNVLTSQMKRKKFILDVVVFNAAVFVDKNSGGFEAKTIREVFDINFFSIIEGIEKFTYFFPKTKIHFIAISSSSALKGSKNEGIAYAASKVALSIAFESLYQRFKNTNFLFTTVSFGPISGGMNPRPNKKFGPISEERAVLCILKVIRDKEPVYECPKLLFIGLRFTKLLPLKLSLSILNMLEGLYLKL